MCLAAGIYCLPPSTEASCTLALTRDVVTKAPITTGTVLAAVNAILAKWTRLGTNRALWRITGKGLIYNISCITVASQGNFILCVGKTQLTEIKKY